ncbi:hypothetical protein PVLB_23925 [Pseudomonas sp. VLB120]|nr:hypothetical protein PVLB_23925 [Pseudomonas sp. VLB120]
MVCTMCKDLPKNVTCLHSKPEALGEAKILQTPGPLGRKVGKLVKGGILTICIAPDGAYKIAKGWIRLKRWRPGGARLSEELWSAGALHNRVPNRHPDLGGCSFHVIAGNKYLQHNLIAYFAVDIRAAAIVRQQWI